KWDRVTREYWWHAIDAAPVPARPSALFVGLGGGTSLHVLRARCRPRSVTVIERDPVILEAAHDWFGLERVPGVEYLTGEADVVAETAPPVGLVILVIALEPHHAALVLEGEHVGGYAVEEPAVVADHDRAAREVEQAVLEGTQRVHVEIVAGLVEEQHVAAALEHLGQVQAIALAARELADALLLVAALEVERGDVGARLQLPAANVEDVLAARDLLPHRLLAVEGVTTLVDVGKLHAVADPQRAAVGRVLAGDHAEERRLAGTIGPDDADDATAGQP